MFPTEMKLCCKILGMAMTEILPSSRQEKMAARFSVFTPASLRRTTRIARMQLTPWHKKGCPCDTSYAHFEGSDEENIHCDVGGRGCCQEDEGCLGISQCGEDSGSDIIKRTGMAVLKCKCLSTAWSHPGFSAGVLMSSSKERQSASPPGHQYTAEDSACNKGWCRQRFSFHCTVSRQKAVIR